MWAAFAILNGGVWGDLTVKEILEENLKDVRESSLSGKRQILTGNNLYKAGGKHTPDVSEDQRESECGQSRTNEGDSGRPWVREEPLS